jgi:hypothetical protein
MAARKPPRQPPPKAWKPGQSGSPATQFQPGKSGNPGGRRKIALLEAAQDITDIALNRLRYLVDHAEDERVQLDAASEILNRGWGRPAVAVFAAVNVAVGGIDAPPRPPDIESAEAWLKRRRAELAMLDGPPPVSAEPAPHANNEPPPAQHQPRVEVREVVRPAEDR